MAAKSYHLRTLRRRPQRPRLRLASRAELLGLAYPGFHPSGRLGPEAPPAEIVSVRRFKGVPRLPPEGARRGARLQQKPYCPLSGLPSRLFPNMGWVSAPFSSEALFSFIKSGRGEFQRPLVG
jgi:hypothetical protein